MKRSAQAASVVAIVGLAAHASAQDRRTESAAREALKRAPAEYAEAAYDKAAARLQKAVKACTPIRCTTITRAALRRDLGVVLFRQGKKDAASSAFGEALALDPKIELNPAYDSADVREEWNAAKDEAAVAFSEQPTGDFTHVPAPEQAVHTPVPVYVEYTGSTPVASVSVKYKASGSSEWKRVALARHGSGWGGYIPCADATRGVLRYFVQGFDDSGMAFALSGDQKQPYFVRIHPTITARPPHLPNAAPPRSCDDTSACPPDQPDCHGATEAEETESTDETRCTDDSECAAGKCEDGVCKGAPKRASSSAPKGSYVRLWVGVSGSIDVASLPSSDDVCHLTSQGLPANAPGYSCTNPDGTDFPTRQSTAENDSLQQGKAGSVPGGLAWGTIRVLASLDYALSTKLLVGARIGYVAKRFPGDAASKEGRAYGSPLHAELRATYLFGEAPLAQSGAAPMLLVAAGVGAYDVSTETRVTQTGIPGDRVKLAWKTAGPGFVALGAGVRYAFSPRVAFTGALKLTGAFGGGGFLPLLSPEIGVQYGF